MAKIESKRMFLQSVAGNQARPQLRQLSFRLGAKFAIEMFGDDELKNGVAQKFQALIIKMMLLRLVTETGMSERFR